MQDHKQFLSSLLPTSVMYRITGDDEKMEAQLLDSPAFLNPALLGMALMWSQDREVARAFALENLPRFYLVRVREASALNFPLLTVKQWKKIAGNDCVFVPRGYRPGKPENCPAVMQLEMSYLLAHFSSDELARLAEQLVQPSVLLNSNSNQLYEISLTNLDGELEWFGQPLSRWLDILASLIEIIVRWLNKV